MIVCRKCSRRHPDGTEFCTCGAYLEFEGEHVADAAAPAGAGTAAAAAPPGSLPPPPTASPRTNVPAAEPAPWSGFDPVPQEAPGRPGDGGIDAVLPDAPVDAPVAQPVWVDPGGRDGDVVCRNCGTANDPARFFCRHCGQALAAGAAAPAATSTAGGRPWWRRLGRRAKASVGSTDPMSLATRAHGVARGGLSGRTMLFRTGGVVVVLGALLAFLGPWRGTVIAKGRELIGAERFDPIDVSPDEVVAVPSDDAVAPAVFELQGPANVVDRFANTAWATRWLDALSPGFETVPEEEGCQPVPMTDSSLRFQFAEPTDLSRVRILGGRPAGDESRSQFRRPRVVELQADDAPCTYVLLEDDGELAVHDFEHDDVEVVTVRIVGVYEPDTPNETVEISEIVFDR